MRAHLVAAALALALAGPAVAQSWTGSGDTVADLQYRLSILDAEMADIRARLQGLGGGTSSAPAPGGGGGAAMVRLDRLEAELRRLTGLVEEMEFRQRQIAEDATRRFGDIEFRLTELEGGDVAALAPAAPLGGQTAPASRPAPVDVDPPAVTPRRPAASGPDAELDVAIADIQQGRFDQGERRLRQALDADPQGPRAPEARFWLGRSHFVRGDFAEAARNHLAGYNLDRRGPMASRNLLQLGVTLGRLGQLSEACLTLREVRVQFPGERDLINAADAERDALACAP